MGASSVLRRTGQELAAMGRSYRFHTQKKPEGRNPHPAFVHYPGFRGRGLPCCGLALAVAPPLARVASRGRLGGGAFCSRTL